MRARNYLYRGAHRIESCTITCRKIFRMIYLVDKAGRAVTTRGRLTLCEGVYDSEVSRGFRYLLPRVFLLYADFTEQMLCRRLRLPNS